MAKRSSKNKKIRLAAIAAALSTGGVVIALLPSANADQKAPHVSAKTADDANCEQNQFEVKIAANSVSYSVFGDLKNGKGENVHHWQETSVETPDYTRCNFTYCGDGGKGDIWIVTRESPRKPGQKATPHEYLNLDLSRNYCWKVVSATEVVDCDK